MDFSNLTGLEIYHKSYGYVTITNVEVDYYNLSNTKIITEGKNDLQIRKFYLSTLPKFFIDLPESILTTVKQLKNITPKEAKALAKNRRILSYYDLDEQGNPITVDKLEQSKKFVISYQYFNTAQNFNIPIIMDNSKLFINVVAACNYLKKPLSHSKGIYFICNGTGTKSIYIGHKWKYATVHDIDSIIKQIEEAPC